jgi:hypothetical protein
MNEQKNLVQLTNMDAYDQTYQNAGEISQKEIQVIS